MDADTALTVGTIMQPIWAGVATVIAGVAGILIDKGLSVFQTHTGITLTA